MDSEYIEQLLIWGDDDYQCMAIKNRQMGHWTGYVSVPRDHPWNRVDYSSCTEKPKCGDTYCSHSPDSIIYVHGGVTFSGHREDISSVNPRDWWFGFDCAHAEDFIPGIHREEEREEGRLIFRDFSFVKEQCESMAKQLKKIYEGSE